MKLLIRILSAITLFVGCAIFVLFLLVMIPAVLYGIPMGFELLIYSIVVLLVSYLLDRSWRSMEVKGDKNE